MRTHLEGMCMHVLPETSNLEPAWNVHAPRLSVHAQNTRDYCNPSPSGMCTRPSIVCAHSDLCACTNGQCACIFTASAIAHQLISMCCMWVTTHSYCVLIALDPFLLVLCVISFRFFVCVILSHLFPSSSNNFIMLHFHLQCNVSNAHSL